VHSSQRRLALLASFVLLAPGLLVAQAPRQRPATPGQPAPAVRPAVDPDTPAAGSGDRLSETSHVARIGGAEIRYTATAGTLVLRHPNGKPRGHLFFVAYVREGEDVRSRPITFSYNGGPGSASIWLHMGVMGPKRAAMTEDGFQPAPPYQLVPNEHSPLDVTDIVMIDPIQTGFSRAAEGEDPKQFHGVRPDIESVSEFIRLYLTKFERWASPKYLLGESYGTVRSAGVAAELQNNHNIELNGIVLVSSVIDFLTIRPAPGNDIYYAGFLPTYTAAALYHKKLGADLQGSLEKTLDEARAFAFGEYLLAMAKGNRLTPQERQAVAQKVARLTGLSPEFVQRANLRVSPERFRKELLRDRGVMIGRLDGRFTALDADSAGETQEFDPSNVALAGPYAAMFSDYVRRELKWETDLQYFTGGRVQPWDYAPYENRYLNLMESLRGAMARNPFLRVLVTNGYYDMATPFAATEYTFDHLGYEPTYRDRVKMTYYQGGHMMYIVPSLLQQFKRDVAEFITSTRRAPRTTTSQP
jgi:carboxypeptidase C (cathepsin A)